MATAAPVLVSHRLLVRPTRWARLRTWPGLPTEAQAPAGRMIRWVTEGRHRAPTLVTRLIPSGMGRVHIDGARRPMRASGHGFAATLTCAIGAGAGLEGPCTEATAR